MNDPGKRFMRLLTCSSAEQVFLKVRELSSDLSDHQHLVRSTILEIHAELEQRVKNALLKHMHRLIFCGDDTQATQQARQRLQKHIGRMSYHAASALLRPCLQTFPAEGQEVWPKRYVTAGISVHVVGRGVRYIR